MPAVGDSQRSVTLPGGRVIAYRLARRRGCRRISITVGVAGVRVGAPPRCPLGPIEDFLRAKADWVLRQLDGIRSQGPETLRQGGRVSYRGQPLELALGAGRTGLSGDGRLLLDLPATAPVPVIRGYLRGWLMARAAELLVPRVADCAARLGRGPTRLRLSDARSRWGSCTADGVVRLSWRLVCLPDELIDYVVAHELSHLVHLDHSARFWAQLARLDPDYRAHEEALRGVSLSLMAI